MMRKTSVALTITFLILLGAFSSGVTAGAEEGIRSALDSAAAAIEAEKYDQCLEILSPISEEGLDNKDVAELNYLLGKAKYIKVIGDIRSCRSEGIQEKDKLQDHQVPPLKEALEHFIKAHSKDPEGSKAPEILYAAAVVQDFGCLNRFEMALETYKKVYELYPDTNIGKAAEKRYKVLQMAITGTVHSSHETGN